MHVNRVWTEETGERFSPREQCGDLGASCRLQGSAPGAECESVLLLRGTGLWGPACPPPSGRRRCLVQLVLSYRQSAWGPAPSRSQGYRAGPCRKVTGWIKRPNSSSNKGWNSSKTSWATDLCHPVQQGFVSSKADVFISLCLVSWLFLTSSKLCWGEGWAHRHGRYWIFHLSSKAFI